MLTIVSISFNPAASMPICDCYMQIKLFPFCLFLKVKHMWFRNLNPMCDVFLLPSARQGVGWREHKEIKAREVACLRWKMQRVEGTKEEGRISNTSCFSRSFSQERMPGLLWTSDTKRINVYWLVFFPPTHLENSGYYTRSWKPNFRLFLKLL